MVERKVQNCFLLHAITNHSNSYPPNFVNGGRRAGALHARGSGIDACFLQIVFFIVDQKYFQIFPAILIKTLIPT